ncbi:helix-turn-helix domain-containing protein [Isobaculum melis]|uniref:Helix-turn-helix domain-containing protein n=1 Tax=Isobaculum melis TaxID=142588 RepID=A0A1H9U8A8_9LACT|nr:helix-turn-helix transcriptional regulator [Isobaculum melis]SES05384.1 Helix-turn-helix domain-containing protein [Isobaculum melis]
MIELLGVRIFNLRKRLGMSQKTLAKGIISNPYLSNIEKGNKFPAQETLLFLCNRLNVPQDELFLENKENPALAKELETCFTYLVSDSWSKIKNQLAKIKQNYQLEKELPLQELSYYLLSAAYLYKNNFSQEADEITEQYLLAIDKALLNHQELMPINQYYAYFCAQKAIHQRECQLAVLHLEKMLLQPSLNQELLAYLMSDLIFCYQSFGHYEKALTLIRETRLRRSAAQQKIAVKLFYLEGLIFSDIQFYQKAEQSFQIALNLLEGFPEMASDYLLLIYYQQLQILLQRKVFEPASQKMAFIYQLIMEKFTGKQLFSKNEYFVMLALSINYLESNCAEEADHLFELAQAMQEEFPELKNMVAYLQALSELRKGNEADYVQQMTHLLNRLDDSWPSILAKRIKRQTSRYFSQQLKYKQAYMILMENE